MDATRADANELYHTLNNGVRYIDIIEYGVGKVVKGVNTTPDVGVDEITKQAAKFGFDVGRHGTVPVWSKDSWKKKKKATQKSILTGMRSPLPLHEKRRNPDVSPKISALEQLKNMPGAKTFS